MTDTSGAPRTSTFATGTRLFIQVLAIAHCAAFLSFWTQHAGLVGPNGIMPASEYFRLAHEQLGAKAWFELPSLCWIFGAGAFLNVLCLLGVAASISLFIGRAQAASIVVLWVSYLSLSVAGQDFYYFQWDSLLLESTVVALFLVPWEAWGTGARYEPPKMARYLVWWLLFRLMVLSGIVKLTSGDSVWRDLTALAYHYQSQPLPTMWAWYAHQAPIWFQKASCVVMFAAEIAAPLFIVGPRTARHAAAVVMVALQVLIAITGNYAFFNLLTVALCLPLLDDAWWSRWARGLGTSANNGSPSPKPAWPTLLRWFAAFSVGITFFESFSEVYRPALRNPIVRLVELGVGPFRSFNTYGLFRVMTRERPELVFEGSDDQVDWKEYTLPYKPGDLSRRPRLIAPFQPRLDWQLWFAALGSPSSSPWVESVCERLLSGSPEVLGLFATNPFPGRPPRYVRVVRYLYEFTSPEEKSRTGNWWRRTPLDFYVSALTLPDQTR